MSENRIRRLRPIEALQRDFVQALERPVVVGHFWVDLTEAQRFVRELGNEGNQGNKGAERKFGLTHLLIRATARAALASPSLHRMFGPFHALDPAHADVAVSVEGQEILTPWYVVREADLKSPAEIALELREGAARVREEDARLNALIHRFLFLFPFPSARRLLARAFLKSIGLRRRLMGTVQFSNVGHFGIDWAEVPVVAELLLTGGALRKRVVADELDRPVVRSGAEFALHGSHRKVNGRTAGDFIRAFREALAHPEQA